MRCIYARTWCWLLVAMGFPLLPCEHAFGEETQEGTQIISESPAVISEPVQFLERAPTIDGILDTNLSTLTVRDYTRTTRNKFEDSIPEANYRLAYGTHFLYVYLEAAADSLIFRDRAYQMGDGFHMVLAIPRSDGSPTEEFYVLACSAVDEPRMEWSRRVFWYYNVHDIFVRASENTKLEFHDGDGVISFELLLPWRDVHPYHPWISEGIGFNIRFVKATEPSGTVSFDVVHDDFIDCELHPRHYALLRFKEPIVTEQSQTFAITDRGHIFEGDSLTLSAATVAGLAGEESVTVRVLAGEGDVVARGETRYAINTGVTKHASVIDTRRLVAGGYLVKWQAGTDDPEGESGLTVLPPFDPAAVHGELSGAASNIESSSLSTLEFKLEEIAAQINSAKSYETCIRPRFWLARLQREIDEALAGRDPYVEKVGFVRKAYRSELDSTLQAYMIWIPEDFNPELTYPLFVYLHGSASTEITLRGARRMIPEGFIALAPRGRGTSNCYTYDHAQEDIAEAMAGVISDYPIDTTDVILGGFSMGGYGVYRTFYETPGKFKALAIFSGHPNIANTWYPGNEYPDFTDPKMLKLFKDVPMFVFHGVGDRNAPYRITEEVVTKLRNLGCQVEFHPESDKGHEEASDETYEAYYGWVKRIIED